MVRFGRIARICGRYYPSSAISQFQILEEGRDLDRYKKRTVGPLKTTETKYALTVKDKMGPQSNRQPCFHHSGDQFIQFAVFASIHPIQVSTVNELVDEPRRVITQYQGKGAIAGQGTRS